MNEVLIFFYFFKEVKKLRFEVKPVQGHRTYEFSFLVP